MHSERTVTARVPVTPAEVMYVACLPVQRDLYMEQAEDKEEEGLTGRAAARPPWALQTGTQRVH